MREKDYYGAIKGFCLKWNLPEVWNSDRITGANLIYEVIKVINAMIVEQKAMKEMIEEFLLMFNEDLNDTVKDQLTVWLNDGTLEGIINETLFDSKADKVDLELLETKINDKWFSARDFNVVGDGVTDDTFNLQLAINHAIETNSRLIIPKGEYVITDTLLVEYYYEPWKSLDVGFSIEGALGVKTIFKAKLLDKPVLLYKTSNYGGTAHGITTKNISIVPHSAPYRQRFDALKLVNTISNVYENIHIEYARHGILLTTFRTDLGAYTEQNSFNKIIIQQSLNSITYRSGDTHKGSSFHGNIFKQVMLTVDSNNSNGVEATALNMESGFIYNNFYDIRVFLDGDNVNLLYINGEGSENVGNITYESLGPAHIKTGNRISSRFILDGFILGLHGSVPISWDRYNDVLPTDLDRDGVPIGPLHPTVGLSKFHSLNLIPPNKIKASKISSNSSLKSLLPNIQDMYTGVYNHGLYRYINNSGSTNKGLVAICNETKNSGLAKFSIGLHSEEDKTENGFSVGFDIHASGKKIKSVSRGTSLEFDENNLKKGNHILFDTQNSPIVLAEEGNKKTPVYTGTVDKRNAVEAWGKVVHASVDTKTYDVAFPTDLFGQVFQVMLTFESNTPSSSESFNNNIVFVNAISKTGFSITANTKAVGKIQWRAYGSKTN